MAINFAGVDLLLEDPEGELAEWMNHHLSLDDLRMYGVEPVSRYDNSMPISYPNFSLPPRMQFNSLYWPTGASRWAFGLYLCNTEQINAILNTVGGGNPRSSTNEPAQLVIADAEFFGTAIKDDDFTLDPSGKVGISTLMYALPPRPITPTVYGDGVWVLPLVDVRYYWQWRHTADFDASNGDDCGEWDDVLALIESALDVDPSGLTWNDVHANYGQPDTEWLRNNLSYANAAVVFDAVAHSIGQRVVRWIDGTVYSIDVTESESRHGANFTGVNEAAFGMWHPLSGDDFSSKHPAAAKPEFVTVAFRSPSPCDSIWHNVDELAVNHGVGDFTKGLKKLIRTTSSDDFDGGDPTTENADLASQIAEDFYGWLRKRHDQRFISVKAWNTTGFDDFALWDFGLRRDDGSYAASTRVQSVPYNFGIEQQIQQCGTAAGCVEIIRFTIITADCAAKTALVQIDARLCGVKKVSEETQSEQVTVKDPQGCYLDEPDDDLVNREGWATYMEDDYTGDCNWDISALCCDPVAC